MHLGREKGRRGGTKKLLEAQIVLSLPLAKNPQGKEKRKGNLEEGNAIKVPYEKTSLLTTNEGKGGKGGGPRFAATR